MMVASSIRLFGGAPEIPPRSSHVLQVRSIDLAFLRVLNAKLFNGRVHSVFKRVVNLECASGELFTLASRELDNAPNTAILDVADFRAASIAVGSPFFAVDAELHLGCGVEVHWASSSMWHASLPRYTGVNGALPTHLSYARKFLAQYAWSAAHEAAAAHNIADNAFAIKVKSALEQRSTLLLDALEHGWHATARRHAISLIGLGPGLTPAGDDFLVGLFAVLNLADSPCRGWLGGGKHVLGSAEESTNSISLAALIASANGRVRETITALIESLMYRDPAMLGERLSKVLDIGALSGAYLVAGTLAGLDLNLRVEMDRLGEPRSRNPITGYMPGGIRAAPHTDIESTGVQQS
jgi:hypothetical protein